MKIAPHNDGSTFGVGPAFRAFWKDETGAVTVDWVVLTAGLVVLGLAVGGKVSSGATTLSNDVSADLNALVTP